MPAGPPKLSRREKWVLAVGAAIAALLIVLRSPLNQAVADRFVLRIPNPSHDALERRFARQSNPVLELERLWDTRGTPHRLVAMEALRDQWVRQPVLQARLRPLLLEALSDGDLDVSRGAIDLVAENGDEDAMHRLCALLREPDPYVRYLAIRGLRRGGHRGFTLSVFPMLDDPQPDVQIAAATALRKWHGVDFGVRGTSSPGKVQAAVVRWHEWLRRNPALRSEAIAPQEIESPKCRPQIAYSCTLEGVDGAQHRVGGIAGRLVVLCFFSTHEHRSVQWTADLARLPPLHREQLKLLPISVDTVRTRHEGGDHIHAHHHHGHESRSKHSHHACETESGTSDVRGQVREVCRSHGIPAPVLLATGKVVAAYVPSRLPTTVIIASNGHLRRRFSGTRPLAAVEAMCTPLMSPPQENRLEPATNWRIAPWRQDESRP